jgi:hypothetical protein
VLNVGPVPPMVLVTPQQYDLTLQPFYDAPQPGPFIGPVPSLVNAPPQQYDFTTQGVFSHPLITKQGKLGAFVQTLPQKLDYTLPASVFEPLVARIVYVAHAAIRIELGDYGKRIELNAYLKRITPPPGDS